MALRAKAITLQLARLSATGLRPATQPAACACAFASSHRLARRFLSTESKNHTTTIASSAASDIPTSMVPDRETTGKSKADPYLSNELAVAEWPLGHGDRIWFFRHIVDGLTIFSLQRVFKANKQMRTLPFNGKKLKPSKFRKDYWEPFAMVEFPENHRLVGLSVYHMLREAHFLHTYMWSPTKQPDLVKDPKTNETYDKQERGLALNKHMLPNSIADMAAVLGGLGKGNKIWTTPPTTTPGQDGATTAASGGVRAPVTVYWSDIQLKDHATSWPDNVTHVDAALAEESVLGAPMPVPTDSSQPQERAKPTKEYSGEGESENSLKPKSDRPAKATKWAPNHWEKRGRVSPKVAKKRKDYY